LGLSAVILVTGLYEFVVNEYEDDLGRTYPELAQDSYVYDEQGKKIGEIPAAESRETVGRPGFGEHLPQAVVAVEDRRFYEHFGVAFEGLGRAAWTDLRAWEVQESGSTISEQLMKNLYVPEEERLEISFWRRFVQSSLASPTSRTIRKNRSLPPT
jgi:membrane peptidoglycan carboxypeptidase